MDSLKAIGKKLREMRIKAGYKSYEHFAWDNDLNRQTVERAEQGKNISIKTLISILKVHKTPLNKFFEDIK